MNQLQTAVSGSGVMIDRTVDYYNENAQSFFETTVNADMSLQLEDFIKLLPARIYSGRWLWKRT